MDTLARQLLYNDLEIVSASHIYTATQTKNVLRVEFFNIKLPPNKRNERKSSGYIHFRIQPSKSVEGSTLIYNTANIYFDNNVVIKTNTTLTTFLTPIIASTEEMNMYKAHIVPNPAENKIQVKVPDLQEIYIYDPMGNLIIQQKVYGSQEIDVQNLKKGIYYYILGNVNGKIILE